MTYQDTLDYLFSQLAMFQRVGGAAYKAGLDTSLALDELFGHPHKAYRTIHVAGTNGKGSTSHLLASILQESGYKVGLYTSPHLVDFRERIRVNGEMISEQHVVDFVERFRSMNYDGIPSFFELTMMMAFDYFREQKVDIAVIEVGLGGRLDSTNIISPILSAITNISFDHTQFLGTTLAAIAGEKAGIMKKGVPVVIGEAEGDVREVFECHAQEVGAPILFSQDDDKLISTELDGDYLKLNTRNYGEVLDELTGDCQVHNARLVLSAIELLKENCGLRITDEAVTEGFAHVCETSGLMGRWMKISDSPLTMCDTGHNVGGMGYIVEQLRRVNCTNLRIVIGFVNDKDINHILEMLPKKAAYYFANALIPRALNSGELKNIAESKGLTGNAYPSVAEAYKAALSDASEQDFIFVGGSTFIVADLLTYLGSNKKE